MSEGSSLHAQHDKGQQLSNMGPAQLGGFDNCRPLFLFKDIPESVFLFISYPKCVYIIRGPSYKFSLYTVCLHTTCFSSCPRTSWSGTMESQYCCQPVPLFFPNLILPRYFSCLFTFLAYCTFEEYFYLIWTFYLSLLTWIFRKTLSLIFWEVTRFEQNIP